MNEKELCWNITTRCNQNCIYCHRFLNLPDLRYKDNLMILKKLIKSGITNITWTGGECLLYKHINKLLKYAKKHHIKNKIITNGNCILNDVNIVKCLKFVDILTLSIDSILSEDNATLGRGFNHFNNIKLILDNYLNDNVLININSVITQINKDNIDELAEFLGNYRINEWRIFNFTPLREKAIKNSEILKVNDEEYFTIIEKLKQKYNNLNIVTRNLNDLESNYLLIVANGDIYITKNNEDIKLGNALEKFSGDLLI